MAKNRAAHIIIERIWVGRSSLLELGCDPGLRHVEIVMSVDLHMRVMTGLSEDPSLRGAITRDDKLPAGIRIFGLVVRRDPTFAHDRIAFRSEVDV